MNMSTHKKFLGEKMFHILNDFFKNHTNNFRLEKQLNSIFMDNLFYFSFLTNIKLNEKS
jgi:hypothetical protein